MNSTHPDLTIVMLPGEYVYNVCDVLEVVYS